jgi:peptidoglycan-associated lipoprotein
MSDLQSFKFAVFSAWTVLAIAFASFGPSASAQDDDMPDQLTAAELLQDGIDAAADDEADSARRLFRQVITNYPATPEAARARKALSALEPDDGDGDADGEAIEADAAERTRRYRRAFLVDVGDRVFFAESSASIGGRARSTIENQARWLKARPDLTVTVIGRADDGGGRAEALALSRERAEAVRARLIAAGIDAGRIEIRAVGDGDRQALCKSPLCQAQNRNSEVLINDWRGGYASENDLPATSRPDRRGDGALQ